MALTIKSSKKKREYRKGNLKLTSRDNPEIIDWAVGEEYDLTVKVRQTAIREVDEWEIEEYGFKKGDLMAEFDIVSAKGQAMKAAKGVYINKKSEE